ncbi:MAG: HAD hydrolase family protein [Proteobacteria bacterium]|nr:HAD hydrolase family protein [Pseudomonadota bacterium]
MNANDRGQAAKIRLLVLDVDGVLTDGGLYYDHQGNVSKRFNVQDGLGIKLAQAAGLQVAVITGLNHPAVESRVRELGITEYHAGHLAKIPLLMGICERLSLDLSQVAYLGDDWVDAGPMRVVGLPMAVANAQSEILVMADIITEAKGGDGAVREAIRHILEARGDLDALWEEWGNR